MIAQERRAILLEKLRDSGFLQVSELAKELNISSATVRRDFEELEKEGFCTRTRGGALRSNVGVTLEVPYEVKRQQHSAEKNSIAIEAARLIEDGDTLILDAGSTTFALANLLYTKKRLTVVTNDLQIAVRLAANPNFNLICTGGVARPNVFSLQGTQVSSFVNTLRVDKTFLGADAIHADGVVANVNIEEVAIKQAMIKAGNTVILLADSSKFDMSGFAKVCELKEIDLLITNAFLPESIKQSIDASGVKIILA